MCGRHGRHVQGSAHSSPTAGDDALSALFAAIAIERGQACQADDLAATELPQFGQLGNQDAAGGRTDALDGPQQFVFGLPQDIRLQELIDLFVQLIQLLLEELEHDRMALLDLGRLGVGLTVQFGGMHADQLSAAHHPFAEFSLVFLGKGPDFRTHLGGETSQNARVEMVRFGQDAQGPCVIPHLPRVDHHDRQACQSEFNYQTGFVAAGGFDDDQGHGALSKLLDQGLDAFVVVGKGCYAGLRVEGQIERVLGDVNATIDIAVGRNGAQFRMRHGVTLPCKCGRLKPKRLFGLNSKANRGSRWATVFKDQGHVDLAAGRKEPPRGFLSNSSINFKCLVNSHKIPSFTNIQGQRPGDRNPQIFFQRPNGPAVLLNEENDWPVGPNTF